MSAEQLIGSLTWAIFILLFAIVLMTAIRHPARSTVDVALLFGAPAGVILIGLLASLGMIQPGPIPNAINTSLVLCVPVLTLRLLQGFIDLRRWLLVGALVCLVLLGLAAFIFAPPRPFWLTLAQVVFVVGLEVYVGISFGYASLQARGVTRRRLWIVATATILLGLAVLFSALRGFGIPVTGLFELCALGAGLGYFFGFAPPRILRRSLQNPELRAFFEVSAGLPRLPEASDVAREIERHTADSLGAPAARLGVWDAQSRRLRVVDEGVSEIDPPQAGVLGRAFLQQRPLFGQAGDEAGMPPIASPGWTVLAAPITIAERRYGVLAVYARRESMFAPDDLDLLALLATHSAGVLESRALVAELAQTHARVETARLKEDFLSAAAHELKTPLTTLLAQAQLIERRFNHRPTSAADVRSVELIAQEAVRMRSIVAQLLDAASADKLRLVRELSEVDLPTLAREVSQRYASTWHSCNVTADEPLPYHGDRTRLAQLIGNLVENAIKFSPNGGEISLTIRKTLDEVMLSVHDHGIGIPIDNLEMIFERFTRGSNVDDRSFAGMGLGLYLSRAIVQQHGGQIWAESEPGRGSTFYVSLPIRIQGAEHDTANPGR